MAYLVVKGVNKKKRQNLYPSLRIEPHTFRVADIRHINNGTRTEWSPIQSVIIRVINEIGQPRSGSPICLITSMITE